MRRRPPRPTRPDTLFPYPTLFLSPPHFLERLRQIRDVVIGDRTGVAGRQAGVGFRVLAEGLGRRFQERVQLRHHPFVAERLLLRRRLVPVLRLRKVRLHSGDRSEEHTSELQSLMRISYAVFCLKKKKKNTNKQRN